MNLASIKSFDSQDPPLKLCHDRQWSIDEIRVLPASARQIEEQCEIAPQHDPLWVFEYIQHSVQITEADCRQVNAGWIPWRGVGSPPTRLSAVRLRSGEEILLSPTTDFVNPASWRHEWGNGDIVAFRKDGADCTGRAPASATSGSANLQPSTPDPVQPIDEWIPLPGGVPAPSAARRLKLRDGRVCKFLSQTWRWTHLGTGTDVAHYSLLP